MPARTDQAWRFSNIGALDLSPYSSWARLPRRRWCARSSIARLASIKPPAGWFLPTIISSNGTSFPKRCARPASSFQPFERAMIEHEELFRRYFMSQPAIAWLRQVCRAARSVRPVRHLPLRPARCGSRIAARNLPLAARGERRDFPAHAPRGRGTFEGHARGKFPLDRSPPSRLRLRRQRPDRGRGREGHLRLCAGLERANPEHPDQRHDRRARRDRV